MPKKCNMFLTFLFVPFVFNYFIIKKGIDFDFQVSAEKKYNCNGSITVSDTDTEKSVPKLVSRTLHLYIIETFGVSVGVEVSVCQFEWALT